MTDRPARQPRQSIEVRREQVLDAALDLIVDEGYARVSMEAVARKVGIAKPVVYKAFPDLSSLLLALLDREERLSFAELADALPEVGADAGPHDVLLAWGDHIARHVHARPRRWRLMLQPSTGTPGPVQDRVDAGREVVRLQVRTMVAPLAERLDLDADLASHAVFAVVERLGSLLVDPVSPADPDEVLVFARRMLAVSLPA